MDNTTIQEATNVVITRITNLVERENVAKIIGHILINFHGVELVRLASCPDYVLHSIVFEIKTLMGLSSSALSHPNPTPVQLPRSRSVAANSFSRFHGNHPSPPRFKNNPISPKFGSFASPDHGSVSKSCLSPRAIMGGECDFDEEQIMREYFSLHRDGDFVDPNQLELGHDVCVGNAHFRRTYSPAGSEQIGFKPCLYFAKGFCKNGKKCKFLRSDLTNSVGPFVGSPTRIERLERDEFMRLDAAQRRRVMAMAAATSPPLHDKDLNFSMPRQNDFQGFGRSRSERNEFLAMLAAGKQDPSSRQIYLTFPFESTFKDQDVSEYFSTFGPVKDVRIPHQKKRMFGFVTFDHPETVRAILSKGNPHYICDARVLVKPYKEKGKLLDKGQQRQQPQLETEEFSPCLNPFGHESYESKEPNDFHLGARMFYDPHEISLRNLMNLHLPDLRNNPIGLGASMPSPHIHDHFSNLGLSSDNVNGDITGFSGNSVSSVSLEPLQEFDLAGVHDKDNTNGMESTDAELRDIDDMLESILPDSLSSSPTKAAEDNLSDFSTFSTNLASSLDKLELQTTSDDTDSR